MFHSHAAALLAMTGMCAATTAGVGFGLEHSPYLGTPNYAVNMDEEDGEDIELEGHVGVVDPNELATLAKRTAAEVSHNAVEYAASRPVITKAKNNKKVKSNTVGNNKIKNKKGKSKEGNVVKRTGNSPGEQTLITPDVDHAGKQIPLKPGYKAHEHRNYAITHAIATAGRTSYWIGYHMFGLVNQSRPWSYFLALPVFFQSVSGHNNDENTVIGGTSWLAEKIGVSILAGLLCFILTYGGRRIKGHKVKWYTSQLTVFLLISISALHIDPRAHGNIYWLYVNSRSYGDTVSLTHRSLVNVIFGFAVASTVLLMTPSVKVIGMVPYPRGLVGIRGEQELHDIKSCQVGSRWVKLQLQPHLNCSIADVEQIIYNWSATILHISAHGSENGMGPYFQRVNDQAPVEINSSILASKLVKKGLELIVLNTCFSANYAQTVADITGAQVIGWHGTVRDSAAVIFTAYFYALLADGNSYKGAFERSHTAIQLDSSYSSQRAELFSPQS